MKMAILRIGPVDADVLEKIQEGLCGVFPETACLVLGKVMPIPEDAYNAARRQYYSSSILSKIEDFLKGSVADCILGITGEDLYVPRLNFVFGEARCPGKAAIISLYRLKPEFYGQPSDRELFWRRSLKEAVHEVGHTLGLGHCHNQSCIMFFSNTIQMTDTKKCKFCEECWPKVLRVLHGLSSSK